MNPYKEILRKFFSEYVSALRKRRGLTQEQMEASLIMKDILDRFDAICNDLTSGLPAEIEARQKQYEYYRDKLLTFKEVAAT